MNSKSELIRVWLTSLALSILSSILILSQR
jgi:hypothetical protein